MEVLRAFNSTNVVCHQTMDYQSTGTVAKPIKKKALDLYFSELLIFTGTLQILEKEPHNSMPDGKKEKYF